MGARFRRKRQSWEQNIDWNKGQNIFPGGIPLKNPQQCFFPDKIKPLKCMISPILPLTVTVSSHFAQICFRFIFLFHSGSPPCMWKLSLTNHRRLRKRQENTIQATLGILEGNLFYPTEFSTPTFLACKPQAPAAAVGIRGRIPV